MICWKDPNSDYKSYFKTQEIFAGKVQTSKIIFACKMLFWRNYDEKFYTA